MICRSWTSSFLSHIRVFNPRHPFLNLQTSAMNQTTRTSFQWANDETTLSLITPKFILPKLKRPNLTAISKHTTIPVVDMSIQDEAQIVEEIARACEEFGFFHVVNHGIPTDLCKQVLEEVTNLFHMPYSEKCELVSENHMEDGAIYKYYIEDEETQEKTSMWAESFFHTWNPNSHLTNSHRGFPLNLPQNPPHFRSTVAAYAKEMGTVVGKLLCLISQGLGLDKDYLERTLGDKPTYTAQANYYPPCPQPELALGLRSHTDSKLLTMLLQDEGVIGLHFLKDEKWVAIDPIPGSLVVNVADQLQVLTNDKYKSAYHRAVTNDKKKRVSFALFVGPSYESIIGPISELIDENNPALYRNYPFREFADEFQNREDKTRTVKDVFKIVKT